MKRLVKAYTVLVLKELSRIILCYLNRFSVTRFCSISSNLAHSTIVINDPNSNDRFTVYVNDHNNIYKFEFETPSDNQVIRYSIETYCQSKTNDSDWCFGKTIQTIYEYDAKGHEGKSSDISILQDENGEFTRYRSVDKMRSKGYEFLTVYKYILYPETRQTHHRSFIFTFNTDESATMFFKKYMNYLSNEYDIQPNCDAYSQSCDSFWIGRYEDESIETFNYSIYAEGGRDGIYMKRINPNSNKWKFIEGGHSN